MNRLPFFELLCILLASAHFATACRGKRVHIGCDNEAAISDLVSCFSGLPLCLNIIASIRDLGAEYSTIPSFDHFCLDST